MVDKGITDAEFAAVPALLTVESSTLQVELGRDVHHVVFWDGWRLFDPQPANGDPTAWPERIVDASVALQYFQDGDQWGLGDWIEYFLKAPRPDLTGALGRDYAEGLPAWISND